MQFHYILPALFAASALATNFERFNDTSCQNYAGSYNLVTAKELEDIVVKLYPAAPLVPEASRAFATTFKEERCPSNKDDTYKWIFVPQWSDKGSIYGTGNGGAVAVIYYNETDTYLACRYMASVQPDGYAGFCK